MIEQTKIVNFHEYCDKCKYKKLDENEDPCWDCLCDPVNAFSHKPTRFEEAENEKKSNKV